jgi:hypothetical protein
MFGSITHGYKDAANHPKVQVDVTNTG